MLSSLNKKIVSASIIIMCLLGFFPWQSTTYAEAPAPIPVVEPVKPEIVLTHRQEVWLYALEWCESQGVYEAVNKKDVDGTPSYYSFQFKPGTFKGYVLRYEILKKEDVDTNEELMEKLKSYSIQREILKNMLQDKTVRWASEFPDCVKNKIGYPPITKAP